MVSLLSLELQERNTYGFLSFIQYLRTYIRAGRRVWHVPQNALTGPASYIDSVTSIHIVLR